MSRLIESLSSRSRSSGDCGRRLGSVEGAVAEHREEDVGPPSGEAEQSLGVVLALGDFLVVVGPRCRVAQGRECGEEEGPFELLVSSPGGLFAADRGPGTAGRRGETRVGGEVADGREGAGSRPGRWSHGSRSGPGSGCPPTQAPRARGTTTEPRSTSLANAASHPARCRCPSWCAWPGGSGRSRSLPKPARAWLAWTGIRSPAGPPSTAGVTLAMLAHALQAVTAATEHLDNPRPKG